MNIMTKEEAKDKLRKAESDLRMANVVSEMHEQGVQEIKDVIEKLQAIINKPGRWQDSLVQPDKDGYFYLTSYRDKGLVVSWNCETERKPEHSFKTKEQAELIKEKMLLMQEMHAFANARNEGWMPDWGNHEEKYGISMHKADARVTIEFAYNEFVFGVAVKSKEIAREMREIFGERIEKFYNKMY